MKLTKTFSAVTISLTLLSTTPSYSQNFNWRANEGQTINLLFRNNASHVFFIQNQVFYFHSETIPN